MTSEEMFERGFTRVLQVAVGLLAGFLICALLSACRTQYVPVPEYHYDYHHSTDTVRQVDSVINNTQTIIRETNAGDSALLASLGLQLKDGQKAILILQKELERIRNEKSESVHDTIVRVDSIGVPVPVEKKLTLWEKSGYRIQGAAYATIVLAIIGFVFWIRRVRFKI